MEITFINETKNSLWDGFEEKLEPLLRKTLKLTNQDENVSVSIVVMSDEMIRQYNKDYRNIDRSTDVLSFVDGSVVEDVRSLGDIMIASETCQAQAEAYGHSLEREFLFLTVHGYLHLLGYDHMNETEEREMIDLQKEILDGFAERFD